MTKLAQADRIMALPPKSWIMAMEPVAVVSTHVGGKINLPMGARVRLSFTTSSSAFGDTEDCVHVSFGLAEAACFEPVPNKTPEDRASR